MNQSNDQSRKIENRDGTVTGNILGDLSSISGTVIAAINELLAQLQSAINDPNLDEDDKKQAIEQVKVLAQAGQNPNDENMKKQAKKAIGFLGVIAEGLPSAAKLIDACNNLLPMIKAWFGLP